KHNRTWNVYTFLFVSNILRDASVWADDEVKIEVVYQPDTCEKKSKRGDLMNVHYDGFLAKDGSQFYCRSVGKRLLLHSLVTSSKLFV
uniref:Peptidylprolyl isomerase n=1 Tax=Hippocampus comes TaxID=109280 RepID=A0A3Q2XTQ8_HIPCM